MINIKELIREPIVRKLYTEYFCELEASFLSYDAYIRQWESDHPASVHISQDKYIVVEYDDVSGLNLNDVEADYILFTSDKSGLSENAPFYIAAAFENNPGAVLVYGDEDELNSNGTIRLNPWFKPCWSPDTLLDYLYFGNVFAVRTDKLKGKSGFSDIYSLALDISLGRTGREIVHVDSVLFHSKYLKQLYKQKAVKDDLTSEKIKRTTVSVIIPSKDNPDVLGVCLKSLVRLSTDVKLEIIVVDNGSSDENKSKIADLFDGLKHDLVSCGYVENEVDNAVLKYLYNPQPFNFSRMCNQGAKAANGDFLLFLNDDIEVRERRWLCKMLTVAMRPHAGAVGAKLYYPNSMLIQHAGIVNLRLGPVHKLQFKDDNAVYYWGLNDGVHNCIAVTGACLLVDRTKFDEVGGFAEELEVAFNDVDLCFRLMKAGYHNSVCNNTHLWHHESLSRGDDSSEDKLARLNGERELLYRRHPDLYNKDPYYSRFLNHDILDTNYSAVYEYDYHNSTYDIELTEYTGKIKENMYNECLMVSMEYVGDLERFESMSAEQGKEALISGYAYVAGSDNAMFSRKLLLVGDNKTYIGVLPDVFRPDLEINLCMDENALMCGFSAVIDMSKLEPDTYRVCVMAQSGCSRMKLFKETNKYIKVK